MRLPPLNSIQLSESLCKNFVFLSNWFSLRKLTGHWFRCVTNCATRKHMKSRVNAQKTSISRAIFSVSVCVPCFIFAFALNLTTIVVLQIYSILTPDVCESILLIRFHLEVIWFGRRRHHIYIPFRQVWREVSGRAIASRHANIIEPLVVVQCKAHLHTKTETWYLFSFCARASV